MQVVRRADAFGQFPPTRKVVGMNMGVDNMGDAHIGLFGLLDEPGLVARDHIDGGSQAVACTAEKVGK